MLNLVINIALPVLVLLTLSDGDRLGPVPALLLAVAFPATHGLYRLARNRQVNVQSLLGLISVMLTGVIGVFRLDASLYPIKEAAIPIAFAAVLVATNRTSFPIVLLLFNVVQRKDHIERRVAFVGGESAYRAHVERSGVRWAGIMTLSGLMKATLAGLIVRADTGTEAFNRQLATYELAQIPTSMLVTVILILLLIWSIGRGTGRIIGEPAGSVLRGGQRLEQIATRLSPVLARLPRLQGKRPA